MKLKSGIYAAQLVPYFNDGRVNEKALAAMVEYNIAVGRVDGLYVGGSTGEHFLSDTAAKKRVVETVAEAAAGRVSLIAQVGSLNIREAEQLGGMVAALGYDAVSAVTPYYYKFSFPEIKNYYVRLAEAAKLPMLVYCIPVLTGMSISIEQARVLYEHELIAGFKYTSGDLYTMERLMRSFPDKLVFSGYDELLMCGRGLGAYGAIGSTYNVFAPLARKIWDAAGAGRIVEAQAAQSKLNEALAEMIDLGLFQSLKEILSMSGLDTGDCLQPFLPLAEKGRERVRALGRSYADQGFTVIA